MCITSRKGTEDGVFRMCMYWARELRSTFLSLLLFHCIWLFLLVPLIRTEKTIIRNTYLNENAMNGQSGYISCTFSI